jgi:hypothetical protein
MKNELKQLGLRILGLNEYDHLSHKPAYDAAIEVLRSSCRIVTIDRPGITFSLGAVNRHVPADSDMWLDIDGEISPGGQPLGVALKKELRYLTLRKALVWHPERPSLFQIIEVLA